MTKRRQDLERDLELTRDGVRESVAHGYCVICGIRLGKPRTWLCKTCYYADGGGYPCKNCHLSLFMHRMAVERFNCLYETTVFESDSRWIQIVAELLLSGELKMPT